MKTYFCWLSPSPGYAEHGELHPNSTLLYYVTSTLGDRPSTEQHDMQAFMLTEEILDGLLRHDAEHWAEFKTGATPPTVFDQRYADNLFKAYKAALAEVGKLDFTKPHAGIQVERGV